MNSSVHIQLMDDLVRLLDSTGELNIILKQINDAHLQVPSDMQSNDSFSSYSSYAASSKNIFHFKPSIHMALAADISLNLAKILQQYPKSTLLHKNLVWKMARVLESGVITHPAQICITPNVIGLAQDSEKRITDVRHVPDPQNKSQYMSIQGQLVGRSSRVKYICSTSYSCTNEECCSRTETVYVRVYPLHGGAAVVGDQECQMCGEKLQEEYHRRDVSERVTGLLIPSTSVWNMSIRRHPLAALFKEDLAAFLQLGQLYEIVFLPVHERAGNTYSPLMEVVTAIPIEDPWARHLKLTGELHMSSRIYKIYKDRLLSPWSFVLTLSYLTGELVAPPGTYHKLKMGLLLSLVSRHDRLHVLVAGSDMEFPHRLLRHCATLAPRHVVYNSNASLIGDVRKGVFLDAGLVHLAHSGICYMGDLTICKTVDQIRRIVESNKVISPQLKHETAMIQPLTAAIWTYLDANSLKRRPKLDHVASRITFTYNVKDLVDLFGMVFFTETEEGSTDHTLDAVVTKHAIAAASSQVLSNLIIDQSELADFLQQARYRKLEFQPTAIIMIKRYFLSSRFVRQIANGGVEIPQSALPTLLKLAESHAKLSLHLSVTEDDSLMACYIYEESLAAQYGYSHLDVIPTPNIVDGTLGEILGKGNDWKMRQFQEKLNRFIAEFGEDSSFIPGWEE